MLCVLDNSLSVQVLLGTPNFPWLEARLRANDAVNNLVFLAPDLKMQHTQQLQQANEDQINTLHDNHTAWINQIGLDYIQTLANIAQAHADALAGLHNELTHWEKTHA